MSPADAARLELAKRAYRATQPTELEVQTGVRRARLSLLRPKQRRKWFLKGLVFVVLALGGLAYAKPHALGELVEHGFTQGRAEKHLASRRSAPATIDVSSHGTPAARTLSAAQQPLIPRAEPSAGADSTPFATPTSSPPPADSVSTTPGPRRVKARANVPPTAAPAAEAGTAPALRGDEAVSDWGRVGQALAQGDEAGALAALGKLSQSDDESTRDKADLGQAQLMMANGEKERACELSRSLVRRHALGHVQRQAQLLLDTCPR